jgi:hypothetical protein
VLADVAARLVTGVPGCPFQDEANYVA